MLDDTHFQLALKEDATTEEEMSQGGGGSGPAYAARSVLNTRDEQQDAYVALDLLVEVGWCLVYISISAQNNTTHTRAVLFSAQRRCSVLVLVDSSTDISCARCNHAANAVAGAQRTTHTCARALVLGMGGSPCVKPKPPRPPKTAPATHIRRCSLFYAEA